MIPAKQNHPHDTAAKEIRFSGWTRQVDILKKIMSAEKIAIIKISVYMSA